MLHFVHDIICISSLFTHSMIMRLSAQIERLITKESFRNKLSFISFCMILSFFTTMVLWQPMEVLKQVFNDYLTNTT